MQHDFILLDRSASMNSQWGEALAAVNRYVEKLAEDNVDTGVTLVVFDQDIDKLDFKVIRDRITPKTWRKVTDKDAVPRGNTPLNDAIGQIVSLAKWGVPGAAQQYSKVAIIIMTDGAENASKELTALQARQLLDECRNREWQVVFLGANYDNIAQATSYGTQARNTVMSTTRNLGATMGIMAGKRAVYGASIVGQSAATMDWDEQEKAAVSGKVPPTT